MNPRETFQNIKYVITQMISARLADSQRYPAMRMAGEGRCIIGIEGSPDLSASMKDTPYPEVYSQLDAAKAFNIKMIDGALIQMTYTFSRNEIESHRLAFFPSPNLASYDERIELYEEDEVFADIIARYLVRFPVRFDFSCKKEEHIELDHAKCHLSLGQYKNCRIPVNAPLTPTRFMRFIVRNFYFAALGDDTFSDENQRLSFLDTISEREQNIGHFIS